jgi:predicted NBD/HSP70 family sugar kinase
MSATGERRASATDAAILEIVRRRSETSRVEISRELGVTPATVTYAVKRLLGAELLVESGFARSNGGKRASLLRLNDQARWAIGCTIDADRLSLAGVDLTGGLRARIAVPLAHDTAPAEIGKALRHALSAIRPDAWAQVATGIGFAIPYGFGGSGPALLREITDGMAIPSISANAPACAALGSFWSGEQPESGLCATVHMDAGLGLSILLDGRPLEPGPSSSATLDHVGIDPAGPPCECGGRGCLHQYASARAITAQAAAGDLAAELGLRLTPASLSSDVVLIALAAARGEPRAREVFTAALTAVAQAVWSATSALGIRAVVLSGPAMQVAPVLVGEVMDAHLAARSRNLGTEVAVSVSQVQPHPCAVGAAVLALQTFMTPGRDSHREPARRSDLGTREA